MSKENGGGSDSTPNNVYIRSDEFVWIPARLLSQDKDSTAKIAIPQYDADAFILSDGGEGARQAIKDYPNRTMPLQNCGKSGKVKEVDDMCILPYLHGVNDVRPTIVHVHVSAAIPDS